MNASSLSLNILALDPSTEATGVVLITFTPKESYVRHARVLTSPAPGDDMTARIRRLLDQRHGLCEFLSEAPIDVIDRIAYEQPFVGKVPKAGWDAIPMTIGALLTLHRLSRVPMVAIPRQSACRIAGCSALYMRKVTGNQDREQKRAELKAAVIRWASHQFHLPLAGDEDAIADACAVGAAAYDAHCREEQRKANEIRPLIGKGSRGPRTRKAVTS